ncbi:hypothetical protein DPEC_G00022970 [Dallia pectoralis]|uniref:Uncharacterized protein n=1 Tax=Dallia pectoralis TaxID=75939 RepID=A0ACC2HGJ5_DALPE|nr:hypothetical protein DPEC_G00022970 [Dallia pectoralis]
MGKNTADWEPYGSSPHSRPPNPRRTCCWSRGSRLCHFPVKGSKGATSLRCRGTACQENLWSAAYQATRRKFNHTGPISSTALEAYKATPLSHTRHNRKTDGVTLLFWATTCHYRHPLDRETDVYAVAMARTVLWKEARAVKRNPHHPFKGIRRACVSTVEIPPLLLPQSAG